jgi:hypothetical protein
MSHAPIPPLAFTGTIVALMIGLAVCGAVCGTYLMRGLAERRMLRRMTFPFPHPPLPDGQERGYAYRNTNPSLYWTEVGMSLLAVLVCMVVLCVLLMAHYDPM